MKKQRFTGISRYLKLYALAHDYESGEIEMREIVRRLAELLSVSERTVWRYASGASPMTDTKINQTVDFLQQYISVTAQELKAAFVEIPTQEVQQEH